MRRFVVVVTIVALLAGVAISARAVPRDSKLIIDNQARWVSPTTVMVEVSYICPAEFVSGTIFMVLTQADTGSSANGNSPVPCTGSRENAVITLVGGPAFTPGQAIAAGSINGAFLGDFDERRVQIVL